MSILQHLEQAEVWTTRDGRTLRLEDMDPGHRRNLQWWLRAHAKRLWALYNWRTELSMAMHYGDDMPDGVFASFSQIQHQAAFPDQDEANAWLEETPFMKRLAELVADDLVSGTTSHV